MATFTTRDKIAYLNKAVGKIFKLLPIYEGKDIYGNVVCTPDEAKINFQKQIVLLETELMGLDFSDSKINDLMLLLSGMKRYDVGQHTEVKCCVIKAINLCKKIISFYGG